MQFALHTESFDANFPLEHEVKYMQEFIYNDIPREKRDKYCELEKIWTTRREIADGGDSETQPQHLIPLEREYVTSTFPDSYLPIGINSELAVGLSNMEEAKKHLIAAELEQYHLFWKSYLRRCRFKAQYNDKMKQLMLNPDTNLRRITEMILRDEELIKFRDSLPDVLIDEGGLNNDMKEREDSEIVSEALPEATLTSNIDGNASVYGFYYQRYKKRSAAWKCSNHVFSSIAPPTASMCETYLMYAFYVAETVCIVRLCKFDQKRPICEWSFETTVPLAPLTCAVNLLGWMAVSNGVSVYQKCLDRPIIYRHSITRQIVSAVHIDDYGFLQMGTTNGQIYDVSPFKLRSYTKDRELLAIVNISTSGGRKMCVQSVNGLFVPAPTENFNDKQLIIMRPLTSIISGPLVFFLTKYGTLKIRSTIHDDINIDLPILKGMTANIDHLPPWYNRGIYFNGKMLAALYPNGSVLVRVVKE